MLVNESQDKLLPPEQPTLTPWKCRNPKCRRTLMEQAVIKGTVVKICERCHYVNVLEDGKPL
jgi:hypothetical protein